MLKANASESISPLPIEAVNKAITTPATKWTVWRRIKWTVRGAFLLGVVAVFVFGCDSCFYFPSRTLYLTPTQMNLRHEDVRFTTSDGVKLHGWFLHAMSFDRATRSAVGSERELRKAPTIVHFHGNAENISNHLPLVTWLPPHGFNVFLFDYRGYGESEGRVTRKGTILDGLAAFDYVLSRADVDPARVHAFGQSLGGAVATVVTAERPQLRGLIADCTFSSYRGIGARHLQKLLYFKPLADGLASVLLSGDFEPIDYVARIAPRPVLVISSDEDEICFPELGRELFDAAREPKRLLALPRGAHLESVLDNVEEVQSAILQFLGEIDTPR